MNPPLTLIPELQKIFQDHPLEKLFIYYHAKLHQEEIDKELQFSRANLNFCQLKPYYRNRKFNKTLYGASFNAMDPIYYDLILSYQYEDSLTNDFDSLHLINPN